MRFGVPPSVIALYVSGDLAGFTMYTDRFMRHIAYPLAPPKEPPTALQLRQRARFTQAITAWHATTQANRDAYEQITLALSLAMTGHNLWIHVALTGDFPVLDTLQRQSGISVIPPDWIPWNEEG